MSGLYDIWRIWRETSFSKAQNNMTWDPIENDWIYLQNFSSISMDSDESHKQLYMFRQISCWWKYLIMSETMKMGKFVSVLWKTIEWIRCCSHWYWEQRMCRSSPLWKHPHGGSNGLRVDGSWSRDQILGAAYGIPLVGVPRRLLMYIRTVTGPCCRTAGCYEVINLQLTHISSPSRRVQICRIQLK